MTAAIVILNWNGLHMLRRFLPGVVAHSPGAQVVVADNGSTDGSAQWLAREWPQVRAIELGANHGFAQGYNLALARVRANIYILLNSDVEVGPGWLTPLLDYLARHPEVAACQPKILSHARPGHFEYAGAAGGYVDRLGYPYCRGRVLGSVEADRGQHDTPALCQWASGACLAVRADDYWRAGGLDGTFFAHQEEIDLCLRLTARGRGVACQPASSVRHVGGGTLSVGSPRKTYLNFRNNLLLIYKNMPRPLPVLLLRLPLDALAAAMHLALLRPRHAWAVCRAWAAFVRARGGYRAARRENMRLAVRDPFEMGVWSMFLGF